MKKLLSIILISLLLFAGLNFAIVKYPGTTIKTNTTNKTTTTSINVTSTIISSINVTTTIPNESEMNIKPTMTFPKQDLNVTIMPANDSPNIKPTCTMCATGKLPKLIANASLDNTCDYTEADEFLRYSHHYGHHADLHMPDYLDDVREDCDLLGLDGNITEEMNATLASVSLIENDLDAIENESQALVDRGLDAIECLREVNYSPTEADPSSSSVMISPIILGRSYPSFPSRSYIGSSYMMSGMFDYVATQVENFYYAYRNVETGYNYTKASMENLENITLGLEDFCRRGVCVWPEDKDFYESLLEHEQGNANYYANRTKLFIDDARDFSQYYHDLKNNINRVECMEFMAPATQAPWMNMNLENVSNDTPKQVISPVKLAANFSNATNVSLIGGEKPKYIIQSKIKRKLLWLFEVEMETKTELNAKNGQIIKEEKPWWSFLVGE